MMTGWALRVRGKRAEDVNVMLRDPDVRMVMATHGGFGCLPLVDFIDYAALRADPKWDSGISDLTILLNALTAQTRVITLHGPDVAFAFGLPDAREFEWFEKLTASRGPVGLLPTWGGAVRVIRAGTGSGRVWGGNLSCLGYLLATPWAPPLDDAILVLEGYSLDVAAVHRWLNVLRLRGHLATLRGLVLGTWAQCFVDQEDPQEALQTLVLDACAGTAFPIIQVDNIGHETPNVPWLVGGSGIVSAAGLELV
jgi:muramoyltetrapeptide carboxypeptidase